MNGCSSYVTYTKIILPVSSRKITNANIVGFLDGMGWIEQPYVGVKFRCLTAWLHPKNLITTFRVTGKLAVMAGISQFS